MKRPAVLRSLRVEAEPGAADLNFIKVGERRRFQNAYAIHIGTVSGIHVDENKTIGGAPDHGVIARDAVLVVQGDPAVGSPADAGLAVDERVHLRATIG